jgi:hypothetical protein
MKLEEETLNKMICFSVITVEDMIELNIKFWISKKYTEFPSNYKSIDVIQTQVLNEDTILLGTEEQFLKYQLK